MSDVVIENLEDLSIATPVINFNELKCTKVLRKYLVDKCKFTEPTKIQSVAWPIILHGYNLCGIAQTGSGKTIVFALPFLSSLLRFEKGTASDCTTIPRCTVLAPTRELATQIHEVIVDILTWTESSYSSSLIYGGVPKRTQLDTFIYNKPVVIVATPGRLLDYLTSNEVKVIKHVKNTNTFVLDEADRLLDLGFFQGICDIRNIIETDDELQILMFSATWSREVAKFSSKIFRDKSPVTIKILNKDQQEQNALHGEVNTDIHADHLNKLSVNQQINQSVDVVYSRDQKTRILTKKLTQEQSFKKAIVFALYKKEAVYLTGLLEKTFKYNKGLNTQVFSLHGDLSQAEREKSIAAFKNKPTGNTRFVLVATDVAARGLDVRDVDYVFNNTFPLTIEDYVHRVGRTGRGGQTGASHTLFDLSERSIEKPFAFDLVKLLKEGGCSNIPHSLTELSQSSAGLKLTKRKEHPLYGKHFRDEKRVQELEAKKVHMTFDDSDDE